MACRFGFKELRAVTPNGVYSLTPAAGNFDPRALLNIAKAFDRLYSKVRQAKRLISAANEMWKAIAEENNLNYSYSRHELL